MADTKVPLSAAVLFVLLCWAPVLARGAESNETLSSGIELAAGKLSSNTALGPQVDRTAEKVDPLDEVDPLVTSENGTRSRSFTTLIFTVTPPFVYLGESITASLRVIATIPGNSDWTINFGDESTPMTGAYNGAVTRSYTYDRLGTFEVIGKLHKHLQAPRTVSRWVTVRPQSTTRPTTTSSTTVSTRNTAPTTRPTPTCSCCHPTDDSDPDFARYFLAFLICGVIILLFIIVINVIVFAITHDIRRAI